MSQASQSKKVKYPVAKKRLYTVGKGSLLDLHRHGKISHGSLIIGLYIEKRSHWDKGKSFKIKGISEIASATGYSTRHVRRCLQQLKDVGWLKQVSEPGAEKLQFEIYPFGEEARKDRQTTAAPLDNSDPLERLASGEISRGECIAWHYTNIGWQERLGESIPRSIRQWAKQIGISARQLWVIFKESRLFQRISTKTHATVLKVFPFLEKAEVATATDRRALSEDEIQASYSEVVITEEGVARYRGEQYRASGGGFEKWFGASMNSFRKWIFVSERVPPEVKAAFEGRT